MLAALYFVQDEVRYLGIEMGALSHEANAPDAVTHPVRYQQTTRILLSEGSSFEKDSIEVEDKAFRFTRNVDFSDNMLVLDYVYESPRDHVSPGNIQVYSQNVRTVQNLADYQIQMPKPTGKF